MILPPLEFPVQSNQGKCSHCLKMSLPLFMGNFAASFRGCFVGSKVGNFTGTLKGDFGGIFVGSFTGSFAVFTNVNATLRV